MSLSAQRREILKEQFERLRRKLFGPPSPPSPRHIKVGNIVVDSIERRQMFVKAETSGR